MGYCLVATDFIRKILFEFFLWQPCSRRDYYAPVEEMLIFLPLKLLPPHQTSQMMRSTSIRFAARKGIVETCSQINVFVFTVGLEWFFLAITCINIQYLHKRAFARNLNTYLSLRALFLVSSVTCFICIVTCFMC